MADLRYTIIVALLLVPGLGHAQGELTPVWATAVGPGQEEYFGNPAAACARQKEVFAPNNPGPAAAIPQREFNIYHCDWVTHVGEGGPIAPLPSSIYLRCLKSDGTITDAAKVPPGVCIPPDGLPPGVDACTYGMGQNANPPAGNPIYVRDGVKLQSVEDFATTDGLLSVTRHYRSFQGNHQLYANTGQLGLAWRFGHEWRLILDVFFGSSGRLSVIAPNGSTYDFRFYEGGVIPAAGLDVTLSFDNTYGPGVTRDDVFNGGGTFRAVTSRNEEIEFELYQPSGSSQYEFGKPTLLRSSGGYEWSYAYGTQDELASITDLFGRTVSFNWTYLSRPGQTAVYPAAITSVLLPDGTSLRYAFDNQDGSQPPQRQPLQRLLSAERLNALSAVVWSEVYHYEDPALAGCWKRRLFTERRRIGE